MEPSMPYNPYLADCYALGLIILRALYSTDRLETANLRALLDQEPTPSSGQILEEYLETADPHAPINIGLPQLLAPEQTRMQMSQLVSLLEPAEELT